MKAAHMVDIQTVCQWHCRGTQRSLSTGPSSALAAGSRQRGVPAGPALAVFRSCYAGKVWALELSKWQESWDVGKGLNPPHGPNYGDVVIFGCRCRAIWN